MYFLPAGIKEDPVRRWGLPDRIFFGFGACHILAGVHGRMFAGSGFVARWIRPQEGFSGSHILLARGPVAFDFHGYACEARLLQRYAAGWRARFPGWHATVEAVDFDLLDTPSLNARGMRGPDQYLHDPIPRAMAFLRRYDPAECLPHRLGPWA